jgi:outer membrane protein assembly factor BamB
MRSVFVPQFFQGLLIAVIGVAFPAAAQTDGAPRWAFSTLSSSTAGNIVGSPTVAPDGTIYIGVEVGTATSSTPGGRLFALRPDGTQKWVFTTPEWVDSTPAIGADGTIYFGCWDGKIYALKSDGTLAWSYQLGSYVPGSPAVSTDGTIYLGSGNGDLFAFNPDGTVKWTLSVGDSIESAPAIGADGAIYFGSWDNNVYAVRPDGVEKWRYNTGGDILGSPALAADGTLYIGSRDLNIYALTAAGALKWSAQVGDTIESSPSVGADGTVFITTTGGRLFAFDADGTEKWRYPRTGQTALDPIYSSPAVRADGSIVFGSSNNALYVLNPDGTLKSRATLGDWADSSPLLTTDGTIYIGCSDKKLYSFTSSSPLALADWPQLRRDPQRTGWQPMGSISGTAGRLTNLSVMSYAGTGEDRLIVGAVTDGAGTRKLLIRGVGPTLVSFGVSSAMADPNVTAYSGQTVVGQNDNWEQGGTPAGIMTAAASVGAFPLLAGSLDAALVGDFAAGGVTVHLGGGRNPGDIGLVEVYDAGGTGTGRFINLSTRSRVGTGEGVLVAGFFVDQAPRTLLIRGIGAGLTDFKVTGTVADAVLRLYRNGRLIAENDNWGTASNATAISAASNSVAPGFPLAPGRGDSMLLVTLPPGLYSAQISGANGGTGVGMVEVYVLP